MYEVTSKDVFSAAKKANCEDLQEPNAGEGRSIMHAIRSGATI
jgi:hypothetical protein